MPKILFAGNTDFSQYVLDGLRAHFEVVGLITSPDKPSGRGLKSKELAIATHTRAQGIAVFKPTNLKESSFLQEINQLAPQILVVVAFRKIPKALWQLPPLGTFNLHTSLLPNYRGAAPIQHAIINGDSHTGATTFLINDRIDAGDILLQEKVSILPQENFGEIYQKLKPVAARLVAETINQLSLKELTPIPQPQMPQESIRLAPKITSDFCKIFYHQHLDVVQAHNHIRGLSPKPCAWIWIKFQSGQRYRYKLITSFFESKSTTPTQQLEVSKKGLGMVLDGGVLWIERGQLEGKKPMPTIDTLNGWRGKLAAGVFWE